MIFDDHDHDRGHDQLMLIFELQYDSVSNAFPNADPSFLKTHLGGLFYSCHEKITTFIAEKTPLQ